MPYTPFIHPDSNTIAFRYTQLSDMATWVSPSTQLTGEEIDAIYSQSWPHEIIAEYLLDHGASQQDVDNINPSLIPHSPPTSSSEGV